MEGGRKILNIAEIMIICDKSKVIFENMTKDSRLRCCRNYNKNMREKR